MSPFDYSSNLYLALGIIALSFPVIVVSNWTYVAPSGQNRSSLVQESRPGDRGISIALAIHSFDPTEDAISDSAEYTTIKSLFPHPLFIAYPIPNEAQTAV